MESKRLTFKQFCDKHDGYPGLTKSEREKRYADYVSSDASTRTALVNHPRMQAHSESAVQSRKKFPPNSEKLNRIRSFATSDPLVRAMLDPFSLDPGAVPPIPDGELNVTSTTLFRYNIDLLTDDTGRCAFMMRASPFAATAVSNTGANCATNSQAQTHYVSQFEWNAAAAAAGRAGAGLGSTPAWAANSWSIPTPQVAINTLQESVNKLQDLTNANAFQSVAAAWRPVCAGFRFSYSGAVLGAAGQLAVARWPGTYGMPTQANRLLSIGNDFFQNGGDDNVLVSQPGVTFQTVQALPGAKVYPAAGGCSAVWAPNGCEAQLQWKSVKPFPVMTVAGGYGVQVVSDTPVSNLIYLPPPVTGDNPRVCAMYDWLYNLNLQVQNVNMDEYTQSSGGNPYTPPTFTAGTGLLYQAMPPAYSGNNPDPNAAATIDTITSNAARDLMNAAYWTAMHEGDTALILVGEGLPASTVVGTIEIVVGVEYIQDTRTIMFGGGGIRHTLKTTPSKEVDSYAKSMAVVQASPSSSSGGEGFASFVESIVRGAEVAFSGAQKIGGLIESAMPAIEGVLAML